MPNVRLHELDRALDSLVQYLISGLTGPIRLRSSVIAKPALYTTFQRLFQNQNSTLIPFSGLIRLSGRGTTCSTERTEQEVKDHLRGLKPRPEATRRAEFEVCCVS
jgi:hypothetical protein